MSDMNILQQVTEHVNDASWRFRQESGFDVTPMDTFKQIVNLAFSPVQNVWRTASYCTLREMYAPNLGEFRRSKSFSALAPSYAIPYEDRRVERYFGPYRSYTPKQSEWKFVLEKHSALKNYAKRSLKINANTNENMYKVEMKPWRKLNDFPTSTSRIDNYELYWRGRLKGIFGLGALFYPSNYIGEEDRRYERIYWGQSWLNKITPSARHATNFVLSAY
ncbi:unnamed protein product [Thelazia callipaeda]|uniref:Mitochondrial import inner membrane translocase subunit Tim29 n=1 Tax=Thelazia callipaeda TaxID=103827 RepID=A0A0N5CM47_THECL|nr:unnamed protein product [Thelazia callipaeda]